MVFYYMRSKSIKPAVIINEYCRNLYYEDLSNLSKEDL